MAEEARSEDADARISALERALADSNRILAESNARNVGLVEQVAQLTARIDQLLELLGRNSKNSHKPPSSDGPASRGPADGSGKPKSGRKAGGQKRVTRARTASSSPSKPSTRC